MSYKRGYEALIELAIVLDSKGYEVFTPTHKGKSLYWLNVKTPKGLVSIQFDFGYSVSSCYSSQSGGYCGTGARYESNIYNIANTIEFIDIAGGFRVDSRDYQFTEVIFEPNMKKMKRFDKDNIEEYSH